MHRICCKICSNKNTGVMTMGEISKLIGKINNQLSKYTQTFKDEFYHPEMISPQMPENDYKKMYSTMKKFDERYAEFVKLKKSNPKDKSENLRNIKESMLKSANKILNYHNQFDDYSTYRDALSKVGAQLTKFKEEVKKSDDPELSE